MEWRKVEDKPEKDSWVIAINKDIHLAGTIVLWDGERWESEGEEWDYQGWTHWMYHPPLPTE